MQSSEFRTNPRFLRNEFVPKGRYGFAEVQKQNLDLSNIHLLACTDTKSKETDHYKSYGVHFFVDDYRFDGIYNNPERTIARYSQYAFLLPRTFLSIKKCHCGDKLKVSAKIAGLRHIGRVKDWLLSRQSVGALQEVMNSASKL